MSESGAGDRAGVAALAANFDANTAPSLSRLARVAAVLAAIAGRAPAASLISASRYALGATRYALEPT